MKSQSPSIVPTFDYETCLVLDDFGRFRAWREADDDQADRETVLKNIESGQYEKPVRVVAFNTAEGWAHDITEEIARELIDRAARTGNPLSKSAQAFVAWATDQEVPAALVEPE